MQTRHCLINMWIRFGIVLQEWVMTIHREDLFFHTLYCRSQSPQEAVLLFFGPRSASLHREVGDFGGKFAFKVPRFKQSYYIHSHPETTHTRWQTVTCRRACFIKKNYKIWRGGRTTRHKLCPNQLNRLKGVQKLAHTKLQPMFSKLPKRNSANHLIFQPEFTVFPCIKMVSTPCWSRKKLSCVVRKLTNTTKAIHVQLIAVIARALWLATVLYTLVFTLEPIPTPGLSRLRLSGLGTRWWSRRPSWKEKCRFSRNIWGNCRRKQLQN